MWKFQPQENTTTIHTEVKMNEITKKILEAHKAITRIKGKEYAPTAAEIQKWINNKSNEKVF